MIYRGKSSKVNFERSLSEAIAKIRFNRINPRDILPEANTCTSRGYWLRDFSSPRIVNPLRGLTKLGLHHLTGSNLTALIRQLLLEDISSLSQLALEISLRERIQLKRRIQSRRLGESARARLANARSNPSNLQATDRKAYANIDRPRTSWAGNSWRFLHASLNHVWFPTECDTFCFSFGSSLENSSLGPKPAAVGLKEGRKIDV